jgi:hypothetical protein
LLEHGIEAVGLSHPFVVVACCNDFFFLSLVYCFQAMGPLVPTRRGVSMTDNLLVSGGSTPCTLQFEFANPNAMSIELGYRIRVIPPPIETVQEGRRRRARACLSFLEDDGEEWQSRNTAVQQNLSILSREVEDLERQVEQSNKALRHAREQEWRAKIEVESEKKGPEDW